MAEIERYDAIVIGSGQGGGPLASALARAGKRTALIERAHIGGTCVNQGCTPTKTMIASARVAYLARRGADYGVHTGPVTVDLGRVRQRKRDIVASFRGGSEHSVRATPGLDLLMGEARFTGPHSLTIDLNDDGARQLEAETIVINAGERPSMPELPGIDSVPVLTSTSIMELEHVPEHLLVLGGGYVGLEFGQMFRRFGSRVTIVQRAAQLLPKEDTDVAAAIAEILRQDGIEVLMRTQAQHIEQRADGLLALAVRSDAGDRTLVGSHLLAAAGRTPNSDRLNLEAAGLQSNERGAIPVNDRLETAVPGIYAIGDVKGGPAFTHISYDDFRILRTNLIEGGNASTAGRFIPYTIFTDPQLGRVGLTERDARAQGRVIRVATLPMTSVARALEVDETRGFMKAVVDAGSQQIMGCAMLGIEGGEIMAAVQVAMMGHLPYTALRDATFAHPTLAESLNNLFMAMDA